jgi:hypothetical protein
MTVHSPPAPDLEEPQVPPQRVLTVGLIGVALVASALVIGLATGAPRQGFDAHWADGLRALLACAGLFIAGCAVSMRPGWFGGWLCGAACGLLGYGVGLPRAAGTEWYLWAPRDWFASVPNAWDSVQLFFGAATAIGLIGALWTRLPARAIKLCMLAWVAYHFAGILSAITSPPPTPWLADQYWKRIGSPYLQFAYFNNAYQFYSPDPGPATELWLCIEYRPAGSGDDPGAEREFEWHYVPRREDHFIDPFGVSFYRRLSLTENVAQFQGPNYMPLPAEQQGMLARRESATRLNPDRAIKRMGWTVELERRVPNELVTRHVLPSFARHFAKEYARPGKEVHSIKIYRTLHMITTLSQFRGYDPNMGQQVMGADPYMPNLYLPYFQGEFDAKGQLLDSTEPLLYWLVPLFNDLDVNNRMPDTLEEYRSNYKRYGFSYYFTDSVSRHAGSQRPTDTGRPRPTEERRP